MNSLTFALALSLSCLGIFVQALFGSNFVLTQLGFLILSVLIYLLLIKLDTDIIVKFSPLISIIGIFSLSLLLITAESIRGAKRWFLIFGFNLQPAAIFLPFFILAIASWLFLNKSRSLKMLATVVGLIVVPCGLVFKQPDLGTSVVMFLVLVAITFKAGFSFKNYLKLGLIVSPLFFLVFKFLKTYQFERLVSFLNPQYDPTGINYNSLQSEIAIGSGFLLGKGFHSATQSRLLFLPEAHTDFAFATFVEAFGLLGGLLILALLFWLLLNILKLSQNLNYHPIFQMYSFGVFAYLLIQTGFNIGMNLRLLPVVGVPLPFISYGGSALLTNYILLALGNKLKTLA